MVFAKLDGAAARTEEQDDALFLLLGYVCGLLTEQKNIDAVKTAMTIRGGDRTRERLLVLHATLADILLETAKHKH